jgi:alkylation response protein AidB-like acyl-CoA dehydrogenase
VAANLSASFVRSMCIGEIEEEILFPYPKLKEGEKEILKTIHDSVSSWLKSKQSEFRKWDKKGELPKEIIEEMKQMGLFGVIIPEEFGGMGLSTIAYQRLISELAQYDGSLLITMAAHSSIGMKGLLLFGTQEQKQKYLPRQFS